MEISLETLTLIASKKELRRAEAIARECNTNLFSELEKAILKNNKNKSLESIIEKRAAQQRQQKESEQKRIELMKQCWQIWFDGAAEPNPGRKGVGVHIVNPDGEIHEIAIYTGHGTNNEAEYEAFIKGLEYAKENNAKNVIIQGDSQLVVNQVLGLWGVKSPNLWSLSQKAISLSRLFDYIEINWISREKNDKADVLSKKALGINPKAEIARYGKSSGKKYANQTQIGKKMNISAIAVGKLLEKFGLKKDSEMTELAIEQHFGRLRFSNYGSTIEWDLVKVVDFLEQKQKDAS